MRIKYEILWVEDETRWYNTTKKSINKTLTEAGFLLNSTRIESLKELDFLIENDGLQKFDLLLVDFMLGDSDNGNDIIQRVRTNNIYTDVVFYSSKLDSVLDAIRENQLEGIYTSDRINMHLRFVEIFKKTIKKIQEVNTIRGLLMAETSELDELMVDIIQTALKKDFGNKLSVYIIAKMNDTIEKNLFKINNRYKNRKKDEIFEKIEAEVSEKIEDSLIFTSFHKAETINKIYKLHHELNDEKFFENYQKDVLKTRNIFAHVKEEDGKLVSTITGEEIFDEERCTEIRKTLIKYREKLDELKKKI